MSELDDDKIRRAEELLSERLRTRGGNGAGTIPVSEEAGAGDPKVEELPATSSARPRTSPTTASAPTPSASTS